MSMNESENKLVRIIRENIDMDSQIEITENTTLQDLGLDSLESYELLYEIEEEFGVRIATDEFNGKIYSDPSNYPYLWMSKPLSYFYNLIKDSLPQ